MSEELQALLKRTQPPKPKYKKVSPEPSPYLMALLERMEARQWREDQLTRTLEYLKESADEIKFIRHLRTCKGCQLEATLSIERYGGRGLPWFFDNNFEEFLEYSDEQNEDEEPYHSGYWEASRFRDCPRVRKYRIGSYWDKSTDHNETLRFMKDRMDWAEKYNLKQIWIAVDYYKLLKEWDLSGEPPIEESLPF